MEDTLTADKWIHDVLVAALPVNTPVREGKGLETDGHPLVVFQYQAGTDLMTVGSERWGVSALYIVKAIVEGESYAPASAMAEAIDQALHRASGVVAVEGEIWGCVRVAPFRLNEPGFRHLGGEFRLWVSGTD